MALSTPSLLDGNRSTSAVFQVLRAKIAEMGSFATEEKKTCIHLVNGRAAFLGVHPRRAGVRLNIVLPTRIESDRVAKAEHVSANRWHNEIDVADPAEVDTELLEWIRQAYDR